MEKNKKKNIYIYIYIFIYMNQFAVHQKLTQHCKSTILQLKKKQIYPTPMWAIPQTSGIDGCFLENDKTSFSSAGFTVLGCKHKLAPKTESRSQMTQPGELSTLLLFYSIPFYLLMLLPSHPYLLLFSLSEHQLPNRLAPQVLNHMEHALISTSKRSPTRSQGPLLDHWGGVWSGGVLKQARKTRGSQGISAF